jgi:hypothetical protein
MTLLQELFFANANLILSLTEDWVQPRDVIHITKDAKMDTLNSRFVAMQKKGMLEFKFERNARNQVAKFYRRLITEYTEEAHEAYLSKLARNYFKSSNPRSKQLPPEPIPELCKIYGMIPKDDARGTKYGFDVRHMEGKYIEQQEHARKNRSRERVWAGTSEACI